MTAMQYSGITTIDPGDHPGRGQVGDAADADHFERVDLLVDPHRTDLRGGAGADGRRQRHRGGAGTMSRTLKNADAKPVSASTADGRELVVALDRDQGAGGHRQEADDGDGAADDRQRAGAQAHLGDQPQQLGPVVMTASGIAASVLA